MLHIFTASMRKNQANVRTFLQADIESINLLSEIRYQLLDDKNDALDQKLDQTFFKCLLQSTDFWINQSLVKENNHIVNEQFWLLIKTIYSHDPEMHNGLFPVHILISLMNEIGTVYTQDSGQIHNCCPTHHRNS